MRDGNDHIAVFGLAAVAVVHGCSLLRRRHERLELRDDAVEAGGGCASRNRFLGTQERGQDELGIEDRDGGLNAGRDQRRVAGQNGGNRFLHIREGLDEDGGGGLESGIWSGHAYAFGAVGPGWFGKKTLCAMVRTARPNVIHLSSDGSISPGWFCATTPTMVRKLNTSSPWYLKYCQNVIA